jgi:hypothetical protein
VEIAKQNVMADLQLALGIGATGGPKWLLTWQEHLFAVNLDPKSALGVFEHFERVQAACGGGWSGFHCGA